MTIEDNAELIALEAELEAELAPDVWARVARLLDGATERVIDICDAEAERRLAHVAAHFPGQGPALLAVWHDCGAADPPECEHVGAR